MEINMTNYAPDPKKERIYSDLATIPLSEVTAEQIKTLTDPVTLSASNQDALITMNTVNKAAMRDGQIMPQSQAAGGTVGASIFWGTGLVSLTEPITPNVLIAQESSSGGPVFNPLAYGGDIFFDENILCMMNGYGMVAGESVELKCAFIRVR